MKVIISPAKNMVVDADTLPPAGMPAFLADAEYLAGVLREMPYEAFRRVMGCSDALAKRAFEQYARLQPARAATPALLAYDGIQYKYMAPQVFETRYFDYVQRHVRILSGLYGVLRPLDAVAPYRLEMQARLCTPRGKNLYEFWGARLARQVLEGESLLIDLASDEYARAVRRHLPPGPRCIKCVFGQLSGEKVVEKGVYVKMARGAMVRWMAENSVHSPAQLSAFCEQGYRFCPARSSETEYVFLRPMRGEAPGQKTIG